MAPVTQNGLGSALIILAAWQTELTPAIKELLIRMYVRARLSSSDQNALTIGVGEAAKHGAIGMLKILTYGWDKNTLNPSDANHMLQIALTYDTAETVQAVLAFVRDAVMSPLKTTHWP